MGIGKGSKRHYNPEDCFDAWLAGGSLPKAVEILYNKGIRSRVGKKPPVVSVQRSANLYMIENPEIVRERLISEGGLLYLKTEYNWCSFIVKRAQSSLCSDRVFHSWLVNNNFLDVAKQLKIIPETYGN